MSFFAVYPVNWSVGKAKKETKRDYKNYNGAADLAHINLIKKIKTKKSLNQVTSN